MMQGQIIQAIDDAHNRGIDIWMKSNEYSGLSDVWKRYCVGTENATFPLIVIDDEIAWYGLPTATWSFKVDKSSSLKTVLHVMVRIKGKNTIEMIKALTELEVIQVGVNKRILPVYPYLSLVTETGSLFVGSKSELISGASSNAVKFC